MPYLKNTADQVIRGALIKDDGTRYTTVTGFTVVIGKDDATPVTGTGTLAVDSTNGWKYTFSQAETNYEFGSIQVDHADAAMPYTENISWQDSTATVVDSIWDEEITNHVTANSTATSISSILTDTGGTLPAAITAVYNDTQALPSAADITDAVWDEDLSTHVVANSGAVNINAILTDTGGTLPTAITSVYNDTQLILADTSELQADWANGGRLDTILDSVSLDASAIATEVAESILATPSNLLATDASGYVTATNASIGVAIPVSQVPVPAGRTVTLVKTDAGLVGAFPETMQAGESKIFAIDFSVDMPVNGRISAVNSVALESGTAGGVTFLPADNGIDKALLKIKPTAVFAGDYTITCKIAYSPNGELAEAIVAITVV